MQKGNNSSNNLCQLFQPNSFNKHIRKRETLLQVTIFSKGYKIKMAFKHGRSDFQLQVILQQEEKKFEKVQKEHKIIFKNQI